MSSLSEVLDVVLRLVPPGILPLKRLEQRRQKAFCNNLNWPNPEYNSQYGQDEYIWKTVFKQQCRSGFFVDIGAYDGTTFSNSYFFERVAGFNGLLIEPNPRAFQKLKSVRRADSINCGIGRIEGVLEFIQCSDHGEQLSCLAEFATEDHLARIEEERLQWGFNVSRISVPVRPITAVLSERRITTIDLLSVDVEGMELEIVQNFPFDKVSVRVAALESNSPLELERMMSKKGFQLDAIIGTDHIYLAR